MLAAVDVCKELQLVGINAIHIKLRGRGGVETKTPGPGAQSAIRALARNGLKIGRIEDVTPIPTDSTRKGHGRRGRRLWVERKDYLPCPICLCWMQTRRCDNRQAREWTSRADGRESLGSLWVERGACRPTHPCSFVTQDSELTCAVGSLQDSSALKFFTSFLILLLSTLQLLFL